MSLIQWDGSHESCYECNKVKQKKIIESRIGDKNIRFEAKNVFFLFVTNDIYKLINHYEFVNIYVKYVIFAKNIILLILSLRSTSCEYSNL